MGSPKETIMLLKVDLDCPCSYKKVKKLHCSIPQIKDQEYNEKQNTVRIRVVCCCPAKIRDKLRCKGGKSIKCNEILDQPKPDTVPKPDPKPPAKPDTVPKPDPKPQPKPVPTQVPEPLPACCSDCRGVVGQAHVTTESGMDTDIDTDAHLHHHRHRGVSGGATTTVVRQEVQIQAGLLRKPVRMLLQLRKSNSLCYHVNA